MNHSTKSDDHHIVTTIPRLRSLHGFTLAELIIGISIIVLVLVTGIPQFSGILSRTRLRLATNALHQAINTTRSEAITCNCRVDLVPVDGRYWENGWTVFIDNNNNHQFDATETLIVSHEALNPGISITTRFTDANTHYIAYNGTGRTQTNASSQQTQTGTFALSTGEYTHRIHVDFLGRARVDG